MSRGEPSFGLFIENGVSASSFYLGAGIGELAQNRTFKEFGPRRGRMFVMPRLSIQNPLWTLVLLLAQGKCLGAAAQSEAPPKVTVCEVAKNPDQFDNQIVTLRATLAGNFEISAIRDSDHEDCGSLWFRYPGSGPEASVSMNAMVPTQPRPEVVLRRDNAFRQFQTLVDSRMYPRRRKIGCIDCDKKTELGNDVVIGADPGLLRGGQRAGTVIERHRWNSNR
jgi:hypothetical protein